MQKEGGRTPQIDTVHVSVTSPKKYFFPSRFGKTEIKNIKYICHHEKKTQWSSSHPFGLDLRPVANFGHVTLTCWVFQQSFKHESLFRNLLTVPQNIFYGIQMNFRLKKHSLCSSRKLYSSLNVTLTYFLDQSMNFIN